MVAMLATLAAPAVGADDVAWLIETLRNAHSLKVRVQAASVLARMKDPRVVPELGRAAVSDHNAALRVYVLRLLARVPGGEADDQGVRVAIKRAANDHRSDVRAQANRSLAELDHRLSQRTGGEAVPHGLLVAIGAVADRTGHARPQLRAQLRSVLTAVLRQQADVTVASTADGTTGRAPTYVIDGSIARLEQNNVGIDVESLCAVQLVVSRPPHGIVMVASGEASVLKPRSQFRPAFREPMESEALEHAVRSAHENLIKFLAASR